MGAEGRTARREVDSEQVFLRGLDDHNREIMSRLLENQAAQLLREQKLSWNRRCKLEHPLVTSAVSQISHSRSFVGFSVVSSLTSLSQSSQ